MSIERLKELQAKLGNPKTYFTKKTSANISKEQFIEEAVRMTEYMVKLKDFLVEDGKIIITKVNI